MRHSGPHQARLDQDQPIVYMPASGTVVTGRGLGPDWARAADAATVSHPAPANSFVNLHRRTRITSSAGANEELGVHLPNAEDLSLWRGKFVAGPPTRYLGGFFFACRFKVHTMPATAIRFFCGISAANVGLCIADNWAAGGIGLWCGTGHAGALQIASSAAGGAPPTSAPLLNSGGAAVNLTAGKVYEFRMFDNPNSGGTVVTTLYDRGSDTVEDTLLASQNTGGPFPADATFMGPQCGMSNAAAGVGYALDIISIYARPNQLLYPSA